MMRIMVKEGRFDNKPFDIKSSPITEFICDAVLVCSRNKKNLVVEFPSNFSFVSLILANKLAYELKKSVMIVTSKDDVVSFNDNYYRLMDDTIPLIIRAPIGIMKEDKVVMKKIFLKRMSSGYKKKYEGQIQSIIDDRDKQMVVLSSDDYDFSEDSDDIVDIPKNHRIEAIVFNEINTRNLEQVKNMIEWCNANSVMFVLLTNFASPNFYEMVDKYENVVKIPFHNGLIEQSETLLNKSNHYFSYVRSEQQRSIDDMFNVDREYTYRKKAKIEIDCIDNVLDFNKILKEMGRVIANLHLNNLNLKKDIRSLLQLSYSSVNSFSTPDHLTKYSNYSGCRVNGAGLCENIISESRFCDEMTRYYCETLVDCYHVIRSTLERCQSPIENKGYCRKNKFSRLFEIVEDKLSSFEKIFVVTPNNQEIAYLTRALKLRFESDFEKMTICLPGGIKEKDAQGNMMIVSGKLEYNQIYIIDYPFNKLIFLAYKGIDENIIQNLIDMYGHIDRYRATLFIDSFKELTKIDEQNAIQTKHSFVDGVLKDISSKAMSEVRMKDLQKGILQDIGGTSYSDFREDTEIKSIIKEFEEKVESEDDKERSDMIVRSGRYFKATLVNNESDDKVVLCAPIEEEFPFIDTKDHSLFESKLSTDLVGSIMIKTPGRTKTLLDILIGIYGLNDNINKDVIDLWDEALNTLDLNQMSLSDLYDEYHMNGGKKQKQTVRTWLRRSALGPNSEGDVRIIGEVLSNNELAAESEYIFAEMEKIRNMKRSLGRRLTKIITSSMKANEGVKDPVSASIWETVKCYLYTLVDCEEITVS